MVAELSSYITSGRVAQVVAQFAAQGGLDQRLLERRRHVLDQFGRHPPLYQLLKQLGGNLGQRRRPCGNGCILQLSLARPRCSFLTCYASHTKFRPGSRFCIASGIARSTLRYQGKPWGKSVLGRVYGELKLNLPRRGKKRLHDRIMKPLLAADQLNHGWSCDLMADALWAGRRFRTFNVIAEFNREALRIEIDTSLPAARVIRALNELVMVRGASLSIRMDNGPEFIADALAELANARALRSFTFNLESLRKTPMSSDSTEPSASRSWTVISLILFRRYDRRQPTSCIVITTIDRTNPWG